MTLALGLLSPPLAAETQVRPDQIRAPRQISEKPGPPCGDTVIVRAESGTRIAQRQIAGGGMTRNADGSYSLLTADGVRTIRGELLSWCFAGQTPNFYGMVAIEGAPGWANALDSWAGHSGITRDH